MNTKLNENKKNKDQNIKNIIHELSKKIIEAEKDSILFKIQALWIYNNK